MSGELDPKYRIRAPLRCDGVGSLDCAEDTESGARLAIRWLPVDANGEAAVQAVKQIPAHPVLPRIRSTGRVGSAAFVAMDFPEGRLLSTMLGEPLPTERVVRLGAALADALATLHAQDVVHGELSADSVLVLPDGTGILWDVPLVTANRLTDRRGEERELAALIRVAPYLSPERARGLPASAPSDLYALGALLCLCAGGQPPPGGTTLAVVHQVANQQWTPEVPRSFDPALKDAVVKMTAADPLARPTAKQAAQWLQTRLVHTPTIPEMPAVTDPAPYAVLSPPPLPVPLPAAAPTDPQALPPVVLEPDLEVAARALKAVARQRMLITSGIVAACVLLAAIITLFALGTSNPEAHAAPLSTERAPQALTEQVAQAPEPAPAAANVSDLVVPLVSSREEQLAKKAVAMTRKHPAAPKAEPQPEAQAAPQPTDFGFLEQNVPAPTAELKRPDF